MQRRSSATACGSDPAGSSGRWAANSARGLGTAAVRSVCQWSRRSPDRAWSAPGLRFRPSRRSGAEWTGHPFRRRL